MVKHSYHASSVKWLVLDCKKSSYAMNFASLVQINFVTLVTVKIQYFNVFESCILHHINNLHLSFFKIILVHFISFKIRFI